MKVNPKNPADESRDRFIMSKGHAVLAQYGALAELGYFPMEELKSVKKYGSMLQGHPDKTKTPGLEANTGSLGQGLSLGLGMALGLADGGQMVYVILGDGEVAEGQVWEAAMAAAYYKTGGLVAIVDNNDVQASGTVKEVMDSGSKADKFKAFGWNVIEIDGHDVQAIADALDSIDKKSGKPTAIIAHTVKGKCVSFAEGKCQFHNCGLNEDQFKQAHSDIDQY
jgi:transketolase